jgi:hypothetical protein
MAQLLDSFKDLTPPFEGAVKAAVFIGSGWVLYWGKLDAAIKRALEGINGLA